MILRKRYYDGHGNELKIDEQANGCIRISVNRNEIEVPLLKLFDMLKDDHLINGKHVKVLEIR